MTKDVVMAWARGLHWWHAAPGTLKTAVGCGIGTALAGAVVLVVGWAGDVTLVRSMVPGTVAMKASTACMFILCGASLVLLAGDRARPWIGGLCAVACSLMAVAFLSEYILGWNPGIDEFPFRDVVGRAAHIAYPGRPAPATEICFVLTGASLLGLQRRRRLAAALMTPVAGVAGLCLVGYAYSIPAFYGAASAAKMALNTGIVFLVLVVGVVFARPEGGLQRMLSSTDPGSTMARRLLPLAVVLPLVLGWLRLAGQKAGLYGLAVGTWLLTTATIGCLLAVVASAALSLSRTDGKRRHLEAELRRVAGEDELTGLPNRRRFEEQLRRELALASRHNIPGALLMIDLDRFKIVNDEHGHAAGDALLQAMSDTLNEGLRETDLRGRLGGDEFVAYLGHADLSEAARVAERILALIRHSSAALGQGMQITVSIGIATDDTTAPVLAAMLKAADIAMYHAKRDGGNRFAVSQPTSSDEASAIPAPSSQG